MNATFADQMKTDIITSNEIKTKLIQNNIWNADIFSKNLEKDPNVASVSVSPDGDKLFLRMKQNPEINRLNMPIYNKISKIAHDMINSNKEVVDNLLTDTEKEKLEPSINLMYSISPVNDNKGTIILDI